MRRWPGRPGQRQRAPAPPPGPQAGTLSGGSTPHQPRPEELHERTPGEDTSVVLRAEQCGGGGNQLIPSRERESVPQQQRRQKPREEEEWSKGDKHKTVNASQSRSLPPPALLPQDRLPPGLRGITAAGAAGTAAPGPPVAPIPSDNDADA